jgi:DNA polymerase-3 subunit delta'
MHHALIFKVKNSLLLDNFINNLCSIVSGINIDDYKDSAHISVANIENNEIKVAEIKKIIKSCELSGHNDIAKIVVIESLEFMNDSATNALLKTLEEPTSNTFFLMFTKNYSQVLDTVKSRALNYDIAFTEFDCNHYLKYTFEMSDDAISKSMRMARNDIDIIARIKLEPSFWQIRNQLMKVLVGQDSSVSFLNEIAPNYKDALYWLTSVLIDVYYINCNEEIIANYDKLAVIKHIATKLGNDNVYRLYKEALDAKVYFYKYKNVDKELVLENLILQII